MSVEEYYKTVSLSLTTIGEVLADAEPNLADTAIHFNGRNGSTNFEEKFLKPLIREHSMLFHTKVNNVLREHSVTQYSFDAILADASSDESSSRTMEDVYLVLHHKRDGEVKVPVNIKATTGKSNDNVCGWSAMNYAIYGITGRQVRTRKDFLQKVLEAPLSTDPHDYFLWMFYKNSDDLREVLSTNTVHSLLGSSSDAFVVNMNQSFPLQFNSRKAQYVDFGNAKIRELRKSLVKKIVNASYDYHKKQLVTYEKIQDFLRQN